MAILFRSTKALEGQIDDYLDAVSQGMIVFVEGIKDYLAGDQARFGERINNIGVLESRADNLRRDIENSLYSQSLIPEHRGDVLGLLESMDDVIDTAKETLQQFSVENPYIPEGLNGDFLELARVATQAAETVVAATRAFFRDLNAVKDHLHKTYFFEKEADMIGDRLKRKVFQMEALDLAQKIHLRYFALHIDNIADEAEAVADRLAIYSIKRTI